MTDRDPVETGAGQPDIRRRGKVAGPRPSRRLQGHTEPGGPSPLTAVPLTRLADRIGLLAQTGR